MKFKSKPYVDITSPLSDGCCSETRETNAVWEDVKKTKLLECCGNVNYSVSFSPNRFFSKK